MSERQYVGIDLHRRRSVIVRVSQSGEKLATYHLDNDPMLIAAAIKEAGENPEVVFEATYGYYWLADLLKELGCVIHLAHPSGLNWENRRVKNDERDALELVKKLRLGELPEAWIAPPEIRELRELVRYRVKLVRLRSGLKSQVHAVMAKNGVLPTRYDMFGPGGNAQLDALELPAAYADRIESLRELIRRYDREVKLVERELHIVLKDHPGYQAIQVIPGVGKIFAAIFVAEIGDVSRFASAEKLCSWAGLTPKHRESDVKVVRGRITKMGSRLVRWAAIEATAKSRGTPAIRSNFAAIAKRRGKAKAHVAVARQLLTLVYYGLRDGEIRSLRPKAA
ncbi:MAG TPA: IS110 family transposase [Acidimicrobiales bacterium]|nr:IS110 family transposase [Acidimicrobiales bacterium]